MKQLHLKLIEDSASWRKGMVHLRRTSACMAIVLVSLLAGCSSDKVVNPDDITEVKEKYGSESGKVTLKLLSGASQQGRVNSLASTRTIRNKDALTLVATIKPVDKLVDKIWSASAIAIDDAKKRVYITWHSDRQAATQAAEWGGALDVFDITNEDHPQSKRAAISPDMKFNHVFIHGDKLFLAATSNQNAGAVGRLSLDNGDIIDTETIDRIGFPGTSVNAVAAYGDRLIAVSGHAKGTYATFAPAVDAVPYYYGKKDSVQLISPMYEPMEEFGGKFVASDKDGNVYVLHNTTGKNATLINVTAETSISLDCSLKSNSKAAESYDEVTGEWNIGNNKSDFYGKHTFVVHGGYAYVACGKNGLRVYDLATGDSTWANKTYTIGVCTDGEYLYTATGAGLRIYRMKEKGELGLVAFEVEEYDEKGAPIWTWDKDKEDNENAATTGTKERHSPNYVAVNLHEDSTYIYIAYGQSGVRVYKFTPSEFLVELDPYAGIVLEPEFGL